MKLVKPSADIITLIPGIDIHPKGEITKEFLLTHIYKEIMHASSVRRRPEEHITTDSATKFVDALTEKGDLMLLKYGTVYLNFPTENPEKYKNNKYSKVICMDDDWWAVTTNYMEIIKNNWLDDLKYLTVPTDFHQKRISVYFVCDRAVAYDLKSFDGANNFSFIDNSENYEFGNEITCIEPCWEMKAFSLLHFISLLETAEAKYFELIKNGWQPQQARTVLPNATKIELIMTGFIDDWKNFLELKTKPDTHPQMLELTAILREQFASFIP